MQGTRVLAMASAYLCGVIARNEEAARSSEVSLPPRSLLDSCHRMNTTTTEQVPAIFD